MFESFKDKRAILPRGAQRLFIETVEQRVSTCDVARICECSTRTIRDWRREKFPMQLRCLHLLSRHAQIPVPKHLRAANRYAHARAAGAKGMRAVILKYGRIPVDERRRKEGWQNWWDTKGRFEINPLLQAKPIRKPKKGTDLAEFLGLVMGDGGISHYQVVITLHHIDDLAYSAFVIRLMRKLFGVRPRIYHRPKDSINDIVLSRRELVEFLHELGLPIGNKVKQQFDIPDWIKRNKTFAVACVRGLIDTDGSVFTHSYVVNGKRYYYKKLSFTTRSAPLQISVAKILADLGMSPHLSGYDVRLDSIADMQKYFSFVGSHNPKHLKRYLN